MAPEQTDPQRTPQRFLRVPEWTSLSPWKHLAITTSAIYFAEIAAMSLLRVAPPIPYPLVAIADAAIMTVLAFPVLYALSFRPLFEDISARQRTEAALRKSKTALERRVEQTREVIEELERFTAAPRAERDLLQTIMENTHAHLAYLDPQFDYVRVNSAYCKGVRRSAEELVGRNHFELFPDPETEEIYRRVRDTAQPAVLLAVSHVIPTQPGREVMYWDWTLTPVTGEDGAVRALVVSAIDVTEHIRAEKEREVHLQRLELLIEASHLVLAETTLAGVLDRITESARAITGARLGVSGHVNAAAGLRDPRPAANGQPTSWTLGTTVGIGPGSTFLRLFEERPSVRLTDEDLRAHPEWWHLVQGRGDLRGVLGARLIDNQGAPCGMILVSDRESGDFSAEDEAMLSSLAVLASLGLQHIQARNVALEKADELDAVFDAMVEPVVIIDAGGTIQRANPAAVAALGVDPMGSNLHEGTSRLPARHADGRALEPGEYPITRALAGETVVGERIHLRTPSGQDAVVVATASPLRTAGAVSGAVTVWHDVTEREKAEAEVRAALERAEKRQAEVYALLVGARAVLEYHDFESAAQAIFASCKDLLGADAGYVALLGADDTSCELVVLDAGSRPRTDATSLPMRSFALENLAVQSGRTQFENNLSGTGRSQLLPGELVARDNVLFTPLALGGDVVGLLGLADKPGGGFSETDARMASAFGELAAVALLNSRSERDLRNARDALEARVLERTQELARANAELRGEIADRERIETALRDSEDRYRTFLQNFQGIAFRANLGMAPLFFHGAVQAITGYSEAELLAGTPHWKDIVHPDDLAQTFRSMELARSLPDFANEHEYRIIRKDGQVRWLREYIRNICDASGTPTLIQGALYDITERTESERHKAVTHALLELFAQKATRREYLAAAVELIRGWTGVQSVGVRLGDFQGDSRYEAQVGFDHEFLDAECSPADPSCCPCTRVTQVTLDQRDLAVTTTAGSFHCPDVQEFLGSLEPDETVRYDGVCLRAGSGSVALVPVRYQGRVLGGVHLADNRPGAVSAASLAFAESLAPLLGEAVQRFNLEEELRRFAKEQSVLYAVATAASSHLDTTTLLDAVLEVVLPALDTDAGWVSLPGPTIQDPPQVVASYGVPQEFVAAEESSPFATSPSCGPLLCGSDMADSPQHFAQCRRLSAHVRLALGMHSHVSVPLYAGGDLLGILNIAWREPHTYTPEERAMLRAVGDLVGVALANARLFKTAQDRARQLATLNGIGQALGSSLDLDQVLGTLIEELRSVTGAQAGFVALADEDTGDMVYRHVAGTSNGDLEDLRVPRGEGLASWAVANRQAVIANAGDPGDRFEAEVRARPGIAVSGIVVAPLLARDRVVGIVELCNKRDGVFTAADARLLESAAAAAAVAVDNARLFNQVRAERERLQVLSRQLVEVQETERMVVARELHDDAGQTLAALMVGLRLLEREAVDPAAVIARAAELKRTADGVLENLHRLASNLRPASLDHLGLVATLRQVARSLNSESGLAVVFEATGFDVPRLPPAVETALYRIAQEAMTNAIRHAQASRIEVALDRREDRVIIAIEDDGIGFDPDSAVRSRRLGLVGMRERVEMLGGKLRLESSPGAGTGVFVEVPYADSHPDSR